MKTIKFYFLLLVISIATCKYATAQIVLSSLQASSYVPLQLEITGITNITNNTAIVLVTASASTNGRTSIGVCWSTSTNPTTSNNFVNYGGTLLSFSLNIAAGINPNTLYYVRPFMVINGITIYGDNFLFTSTNGALTPRNGLLNYVTMSTPNGQYADAEAEFDSQIAPGYGNIIQTGTANINVIINFSDRNQLSSAMPPIAVTSNGENFSIVAIGFFIPLETGTYTFSLGSDDAGDLFINGINVTNDYGGQALPGIGANPGTISVTAGVKYSFRARMQEFQGGEGLRIFWRKPSQATGWFQDTGEISSN